MTDSIDLDEMTVDDSADDQESDANYGDWLWRGEGDPEDEPEPRWTSAESSATDAGDGDSSEVPKAPDGDEIPASDEVGVASGDSPASAEASADVHDPDDSDSAVDADGSDSAVDADDSGDDESAAPRTPKVPGGPSGPVGVPESKGGSGGGSPSSSSSTSSSANADEPTATDSSESSQRTTNHGEETEADDMTLAMTYEAINRLEDPRFCIADARSWSDWIGIVGKVSTPAIRKFQRDHTIELDFFGGSENGPDQRLVDITPESMFYAERMVLVGTAGDEWIAEAADWEFVPLETAAENADWEIEHAE
ncbi:hypothetical protein SAMN04487967_2614 [Natronorubrum sediminis]|uniref:DUF7124 domain-containing protein n=1 Tax=Natronorubrum sediminis TaxID=640943 RepID=A0A1H6G1D9_9EURY|nr:hypothetical protein [Natronorubrum sediminis]SEH16422.1 hypothetical protein SAMN04487967_2614 [Natronorubrum sediminis]